MELTTTFDSVAAFDKSRRQLAESSDWWSSADPINPGFQGGYSGFGYRGVSGGVGDRKGGRDLPIFWNELDLRWYRILARHLDSTNNFAIGFLNHLVGYNIRKGFGWQACKKGVKKGQYATGQNGQDPLIAKSQNILDSWRDANNWPVKSRGAYRIWRREGEVFGRFFAGGWDRLPAFRLIAGELVGSPNGETTGPRSFGIETDPDDQQTVWAYFLRDQNGTGQEGEWVDADRMIHIKTNVDECVKRGVTDFLPMSQELDGIRILLRALLDTSNKQAAVAWREKFPTAILNQVAGLIPVRPTNELQQYPQTVPNNLPMFGGSLWSSSIRLSHVARVEGNREFEPGPTFNGVANYLQVEQACLRGCGHRWGMPELMAGSDASNNNLSSSITAASPFAIAVEGSQLEWGSGWERPIALRVLDLAVEAGMLTRQERRQLDVEVTEPAVVTPEPDKDANRIQGLVQAKLLSRTTGQLQLGLDPQHEAANIQSEAGQDAAQQSQQPPGPGGDDGGGGDMGGEPPPDPDAPPDGGGDDDDGAMELLGLSEGKSGLIKKTITNKIGHKQTVYVSPDDPRTVDLATGLDAYYTTLNSGQKSAAKKVAASPQPTSKNGPAKAILEKAQEVGDEATPTLADHHEWAVSRAKAAQIIEAAPVPSAKQVRKVRVKLNAWKKACKRARKLGERVPKIREYYDARGGGHAHKKRAERLFKAHGGDDQGYVICHGTGLKMHWTDDPEKNPHGFDKFEQGKIFVAAQGGGYQDENVLPEHPTYNRLRGNKPLREENLT